MNKFKSFAMSQRMIFVGILVIVMIIVIANIFRVALAARLEVENDSMDEIQALIDEIEDNDKDIYNQTNLVKIEKVVKGIDVSSFQGDINWEKVKNAGIEFVMIRCGYRNLTNDEIHEDSKFKYNISEANKYDIPVGVYFYSTARNEVEVLEEASFVLNLIKDYKITYPVAYDMELFNQKRTEGVSTYRINTNAIHFLDYINKHGYEGLLYTNLTALNTYWEIDNFLDYGIWFAQYGDEVTYDGTFGMWQYADNGVIDGITTRVDLNEAYFAYQEGEV